MGFAGVSPLSLGLRDGVVDDGGTEGSQKYINTHFPAVLTRERR